MSNETIDSVFLRVAVEPTDMVDHMETIRRYSIDCQRITEFGVFDCTSTWALLAGHPQQLTSYDIARRSEVDEVEAASQGSSTIFKFVLADTASIEIGETDLLFIDSLHTYAHLTVEFQKHADKVRKYILLHDTVTFGHTDENGNTPGLWLAVEEFLAAHPEWVVHEHFTNCHGLTVLRRIA